MLKGLIDGIDTRWGIYEEEVKEWEEYLQKISEICLGIKNDDQDEDMLNETVSQILQSLKQICKTT